MSKAISFIRNGFFVNIGTSYNVKELTTNVLEHTHGWQGMHYESITQRALQLCKSTEQVIVTSGFGKLDKPIISKPQKITNQEIVLSGMDKLSNLRVYMKGRGIRNIDYLRLHADYNNTFFDETNLDHIWAIKVSHHIALYENTPLHKFLCEHGFEHVRPSQYVYVSRMHPYYEIYRKNAY